MFMLHQFFFAEKNYPSAFCFKFNNCNLKFIITISQIFSNIKVTYYVNVYGKQTFFFNLQIGIIV